MIRWDVAGDIFLGKMRVGKRREEKDPHYLTSFRSIQFVLHRQVRVPTIAHKQLDRDW